MRKSFFAICSVLLILLVSIAVFVPGCDGGDTYTLTMEENPAGTGTATDETGESPYEAGDVVDIKAVPADCYRFTGWSAPDGEFGNSTAAETTFAMPVRDVIVTANFELTPADHYKFYEVGGEVTIGEEVELTDQFGTFTANVTYALDFGNPVEKEHATGGAPIYDPNRHYTVYWLSYNEEDSVVRSVEVSNQFQDNVEMTVWGPVALAVPTQKEDHEMVECLNHYLLYEVLPFDYSGFPVQVNLKDQFIPNGEDVTVYGPVAFGNPVKKTVGSEVTEIENPNLHWVLYDIYEAEAPSIEKNGLQIDNQFGPQTLDLTYRELLAVPSQKNVPPTPELDHFKCYNATGPAPILPPGVEGLELLDQFHDYWLQAQVQNAMLFCNPVDKVHGTIQISSNPDNHLTVYKITAPEHWYTVTVDNQFSEAGVSQQLTVYGPVALATPTQKVEPGDHGMPKYIDHYLLYKVWEPVPLDVTVALDDQFPPDDPGVTVQVGAPIYFANPCLKGPVDLGLEGLWDPDEHLVFYQISENPEWLSSVFIKNQFFPDEGVYLDLYDNWELLAAPSVKVEWNLLD